MQHGIPNNTNQNAAPLIKFENYIVVEPDALETPAMLLFQDVMDHNIKSVCELVGGGPRR